MRSWRRWRVERHPIAQDAPKLTPGLERFMQTRELADCLRVAMGLMGELLEQMDWGQLELCDCGHRRCEHNLIVAGPNPGIEPCGHQGCGCVTFDRIHQQAEEYLAEQRMREQAEEQREPLKVAA